jgi:hypothetical protein
MMIPQRVESEEWRLEEVVGVKSVINVEWIEASTT